MTPKIVEFERMWAVGLGRVFDQSTLAEIPKLWDEFVPRMAEVSRASDLSFGVEFDADGPPGSFRYIAAMQANEDAPPPEGMEAHEIPAGKYLVYTHKGPLSTFAATCSRVYRELFPNSGHTWGKGPNFELYDQRFKPESEQCEIDICIPVA